MKVAFFLHLFPFTNAIDKNADTNTGLFDWANEIPIRISIVTFRNLVPELLDIHIREIDIRRK